jgi:hypothetical protein
MRPGIASLAIASIVSFFLLSAAAFAQSAESHSQPPEQAPAAPGAPNAASAENQAQNVAVQIEKARREGKDVRNAETEEKQGEAALRAGYKSEAAQHFKQAEQDLSSE